MKISREVKTALLAIAAIALLIYGYNFMKGRNIFDSNRDFYAIYDNVEGLSNSADVTLNGLKVGSVSKIEFLNKNGKIIVRFNVSNDFQFSDQSVVSLYSDGFIGGKSLKIEPDYNGPLAKAGDTLSSNVELELTERLSHRVEPLEQKLESALSGVDSLVQGLNDIIDEEGKRNIQESLVSLNATLKNLNNSSARIDRLLSGNADKLDGMISNFDHASQNLSRISDSLALVEVGPLINKIEDMIDDFNTVGAKLSRGEGTIGKLLDDDRVYENLDGATRELEDLIQDIKLNPGRYVDLKFSLFGGKNKPYRKPEKTIN